MALVLGSHNNGNSNSNGEGGNYSNSNYIFKEEIRDWYLYRAADKSIVRPYPVYDASGVPCSPIGHIDPENPLSVFSDAFAVVPLVVFAGMDNKLQFIDYCPDIDRYASVGTVLTRTPYSFFITKLREMLPERDSSTTKSGLPTPPRLAQIQKNVHYAATSLLFRGAMIRSKGKASASKHAVGGVMFKSVVYVSVKSAIDSIAAELQRPKDPRFPWSAENSAANGLFELDGLTIQFDKTGPQNSDPYRVSFGYDPDYSDLAAQFFNITKDPMAYHAKVRELFGPNQQLSDMLRLLTVEEMVNILKDKYPISWVYYGLKDSPYASLLTSEDREAALRDPEMAPWFGIATAPAQPVPAPQVPQYPPQVTTAPAAYPGYSQIPPSMPVNQPVNIPAYPSTAPDFQSPGGYQTGVTMGPAPTQASSIQDRKDYYANKYRNASIEEDNIPY